MTRQALAAAVLALIALASAGAHAAPQRVELLVENMYCASCPFIVERTLAAVPGVSHVEISYERGKAVAVAIVDYEDTRTSVAALTAATSDVGFPATVIR